MPPAKKKPAKGLPPGLAKYEAAKAAKTGTPAAKGPAPQPGTPAAKTAAVKPAAASKGTTASKASSAASAAAAYKGPVPPAKKKKPS